MLSAPSHRHIAAARVIGRHSFLRRLKNGEFFPLRRTYARKRRCSVGSPCVIGRWLFPRGPRPVGVRFGGWWSGSRQRRQLVQEQLPRIRRQHRCAPDSYAIARAGGERVPTVPRDVDCEDRVPLLKTWFFEEEVLR